MNKVIDADEIRRWHKVMKREGELFEIRILCGGEKTLSGYFTDVEEAIKLLPQYQEHQIYFTVNEVKSACSSRKQFNSFLYVKGSATSKNDIAHRWWFPIDIDVERPSDVSSTDEEKKYAHEKAGEVYKFLKQNGFSEPVVCDSSSGYHLYYPIDMDNTTENETLIKSCYDVLYNFFTDEKVKIDRVVGDANRIMRLPGSWGRKGRDSKERPHRKAQILSSPEEPSRMTAEKIRAFVSKYKIEEENHIQNSYKYSGEQFDLRSFISEHGIKVSKEMPYGNGGTKFVLEECPFDSSHKAPDSAIFQTAQGAIGFKCLHNSCAHHDWHELRQMFDPMAYNKPEFQPGYQKQQRTFQQSLPQKTKYEVKDESPELGGKWLSMSEIEKVDILSLPRVKTGFTALDKTLLGLFFTEVTLLSGSNSSGKSSWLNTLILNIIEQKEKCALWSGELPPYILKSWIQQAAAGKKHLVKSKIVEGKYFVPNDVAEMIDQWLSGKLFIYNNEYGNTWQQLFNDMKLLLDLGVRVFILDNLFSMNIDLLDGDKNSQQKKLILQIKDFAKKNKVHIILIAHPKKTISFLRKTDISGSGDLTNAVDNVFIIHRVNQDFTRAGTEFLGAIKVNQYKVFDNVIEVCKNRQFGAVDLLVGMYYEPESRRFKNYESEDIRYGWDAEPSQKSMNFESQSDKPFEAPDNNEAPF